MVLLASVAGVRALQLSGVPLDTWVLLALFLAPDLSYVGYLGGPRVGAAVHNMTHLYAPGLAIIVAGMIGLATPVAVAAGLLWMGHVGLDRMAGLGLTHPTGLRDTHLGCIGRR